MGFTFDDTDNSGEASPLAEMQKVLESGPATAALIQPYLGGEEFNNQPEQHPHRFIINYGEMSEQEARKYPSLMRIVEAKVKPYRDGLKRNVYRKKWWQFGEKQTALYRQAEGLGRVLTICRVSQSCAFGFAQSGAVYADSLVVICKDSFAAFSVLQSRSHELWARFFASSMKDDLRYTPSDCFETFPFPFGFETNPALEAAGREYYEFRAALMQDVWLGLTEIYNLFHLPDDEGLARLEALYRKRVTSGEWRVAEEVPADRTPLTLYTAPAAALAAVQRLRTLHAAMDTAVLTAYGWTNLVSKCTCEFLLDYEEEDDGAEESTGRRKRKPWRYRWPDEVRDEVLARLLKLNAERAEEERLTGLAAGAATPKGKPAPGAKRGRKAKSASGIAPAQPELLPPAQGDLFE